MPGENLEQYHVEDHQVEFQNLLCMFITHLVFIGIKNLYKSTEEYKITLLLCTFCEKTIQSRGASSQNSFKIELVLHCLAQSQLELSIIKELPAAYKVGFLPWMAQYTVYFVQCFS